MASTSLSSPHSSAEPRGGLVAPPGHPKFGCPCRAGIWLTNLQPPSLVCVQSRSLSPRLCLHFQATTSSSTFTTTATSSTPRRPSPSAATTPSGTCPSSSASPLGTSSSKSLSLEFTVMQVRRTEVTTAKKVAWITHAQDPLLQPGVSAPTCGRGTGKPGGAISCCPQEVAGVGLVFLGQRVFLALLEGHQPCPTVLLPLCCHKPASTPAAPRWATCRWVPAPPGPGCCTGGRCAAVVWL